MLARDTHPSTISGTLIPEEQASRSGTVLPGSKPLKGRRRLMSDEHREKLSISQKLVWAERRTRQAVGAQPEIRPTERSVTPARALAANIPQRPVVVAPPSKRTGNDPAKKANTAESVTSSGSDLFQ